MSDLLKTSSRDRFWAVLLGLVISVAVYWSSPKFIDPRAWQQLCEGAFLRPPELFQPGLYRLCSYALTRFLGLGGAIKVLDMMGPLALGVVAYQAMMLTRYLLMLRFHVDRVRLEFRTVMMPLLMTVGMSLFLTSWPVMHAAWMLTPSMLTLMLAFVAIGEFRSFFETSNLAQGYFGVFVAGVLSAESFAGIIIAVCAVGSACWITINDKEKRFVLSDPYVYHMAKWTFTVLFLLGAGVMAAANVWFFESHGGLWSEAFRGAWALPGFNALAVVVGLVVAPLVVTMTMMSRSCDNEAYLPYANGILLFLAALTSILFCLFPETVAIDNELVRMFLLFAAAFTSVAALLTLLVDVYCRVRIRYPRLVRVCLFRLLIVGFCILVVLMPTLDGARKIGTALDQCADEIVLETAGMKRLFSDGAMDALLELKSALSGGRMYVHSMFSGRSGEYAAKLRTRDVTGDDDLSMMRMGAPVALSGWIGSQSPELSSSAVQLGFEMWKRSGKTMPQVSGLVALPEDGCSSNKLTRAHAWADSFADRIQAEDFSRGYARCKERGLRESFDMVKWRLGKMLELRSFACDTRGEEEKGRLLRNKARQLDRHNESLAHLRRFMNLPWNQDNMKLTPRESLKIALGRANFRAAKPHAEAILSTNPDDVSANFALGMYHYTTRDFVLAETYLLKAHRLRLNDPVLINNLAIVQMCLKKLESAERLALAAQEINPGSKEIQATLSEIRRRRKDQ